MSGRLLLQEATGSNQPQIKHTSHHNPANHIIVQQKSSVLEPEWSEIACVYLRKEALLVLRALLHDVPQPPGRRLPVGLWIPPPNHNISCTAEQTKTDRSETLEHTIGSVK